jgi:hypothetical protein
VVVNFNLIFQKEIKLTNTENTPMTNPATQPVEPRPVAPAEAPVQEPKEGEQKVAA